MSYLLDTNTCIVFLNGRSEPLKDRLLAASPESLLLCAVVKAELFYGALKSGRPAENLARVEQFAERFVSLPFDDSAAIIYGRLRTTLERQGTPIGPNDLLIAAIALAHDATLVTHNTREFNRVEGLAWEDWQ